MTLTITVLIVKSFYCIVLEKIKSKITTNNKMRHSTCTVSHFQTLIKRVRYRLAQYFNWYVIQSDPDYYCINCQVILLYSLEKIKSKFTTNNKMRPSTCHCVPFSNTHKNVFLYRLAHYSNLYLFRVTLNITVLIVKSFYCIVLEKIKSKITTNNKMRHSTALCPIFQHS